MRRHVIGSTLLFLTLSGGCSNAPRIETRFRPTLPPAELTRRVDTTRPKVPTNGELAKANEDLGSRLDRCAAQIDGIVAWGASVLKTYGPQ